METSALIKVCLLVVVVADEIVVAGVVIFLVVADSFLENKVLVVEVIDLAPMDKVLVTDIKEVIQATTCLPLTTLFLEPTVVNSMEIKDMALSCQVTWGIKSLIHLFVTLSRN